MYKNTPAHGTCAEAFSSFISFQCFLQLFPDVSSDGLGQDLDLVALAQEPEHAALGVVSDGHVDVASGAGLLNGRNLVSVGVMKTVFRAAVGELVQSGADGGVMAAEPDSPPACWCSRSFLLKNRDSLLSVRRG